MIYNTKAIYILIKNMSKQNCWFIVHEKEANKDFPRDKFYYMQSYFLLNT